MVCRTPLLLCATMILPSLAARVSPVQKVLMLIDDFTAKVQRDFDNSAKVFEATAKFCDDEVMSKTYSLKSANTEIATLQAVIENENAKLLQFSTNIQDASLRVSSLEGELYDSTALRTKEHEDFLAAEKGLLSTVTELEGASATMKKSLSMAQLTPEAKHGMDAVISGLSKIVEASFVTHAQREHVEQFLQAQEDSDDVLTLKQEAGTGPTIIETLDSMTEKADSTLSDTRKNELEENHSFMLLKQGMESGIKSTNEELSENTKGKQVSTQNLAQATNNLKLAQNAQNDDSTYVADLKLDCQIKAREYEEDHRDTSTELKVLGQAKKILTKKFKVAFIESIASLSTTSVQQKSEDDSKAKALRMIEQLGHKFHSTMLVSLAYRAAEDSFGKIRSMIEDMIAQLLQEAAEEATKKAFCDQEMDSSTKSKEVKQEKLDIINARIEKAEAGVAQLSEAISSLSREIAEIDAGNAEATALRQQGNAAFRQAQADYSSSQEACATALEVLREYYEGATSLVQVTSKGSDGIISLLEAAESGFAQLLAEARAGENAADSEFKKLLADSKSMKAIKEVEVKGKQSEVKSLKVALSNSYEDKEGSSTELDAVLQYLNELKPQCETKVQSYAEKKAKRENEIQGLKEALTVLEGNGIALIQRVHLRH